MRRASCVALAATLTLASAASAAELSGFVLGFPDEEPIAGAQVLAMDLTGRAAAATTDEAGRFTIEDVDGGRQRIRVRPDGLTNRIGAYWGDVYLFCQAPWVSVGADEAVSDLDVWLPVGGGLRGAARDHDGSPLVGAVVRARGLDPWNRSLVRSAEVGPDGNYELNGLDSFLEGGAPRPGLYSIELAAPGHPSAWYGGGWDASAAVPVEALRAEVRTLDLELPPRSSLTVRVSGADGGPLPGATVRAEVIGFGAVGQGTSDELGEVRLEGLGGPGVRVRVEAPGHRTTFWPAAVHPAEGELIPLDPDEPADAEVVLPTGASLAVQVSGEGAEGCRVQVMREGLELTSAVAPGGEVRFEGLPADESLRLHMHPAPDSDGRLVFQAVVLAEGEETRLTPVLPRGGRVEAIVRTRPGRPLRGARVELLDLDGEVQASAAADGEGLARLRGLFGGPYTLRASFAPFCSTDPTWVSMYSAQTPDPEAADELEIASGDLLEFEFALPPDHDRDGMDDAWELAWGLDPSRDDGGLDPDGDGLDNREEYFGGTDPLDRPETACAAGPLPSVWLLPVLWPAGRRRRT